MPANSRRVPQPHGSPSDRVVQTIADREGVDPTELPPLFESVDPDALDALLRRDDTAGAQVTFTHHGHEVTVRSDGRVSLSSPR